MSRLSKKHVDILCILLWAAFCQHVQVLCVRSRMKTNWEQKIGPKQLGHGRKQREDRLFCRLRHGPLRTNQLGHGSSTLYHEAFHASDASTSTCLSSHFLNAWCMSTSHTYKKSDSRNTELLLKARSCSTLVERKGSFDVFLQRPATFSNFS